MSYIKTLWTDLVTAISATNMNKIEQGIYDTDAALTTHKNTNASETVKGHVEFATSAETTTGTSTSLAVHPSGLKTVMNTHAAVSASETVKGHVELATQSEVSLGASSTLVVTPVTLKGLFTTIITASDNLRASADTELSISNQSVWVKMKAFTIAKTGTYRVKFSIRESSMAVIYGMIYKNGVAHGTQRQATSGLLTFSEDLVFSAGDTCELWIKGGGSGTGYCSNFRIYFDAAYSVDFTMTPNIPALSYGT